MIRSVLRTAGSLFRMLEIGLIRTYRATLSGWLGGQCRFYPSCSRYAEDAIRAHGVLKGTALATWRVLRCNPFGAGGIEPVGVRQGHSAGYDDVTPSPDARAGA
jgi:putative membrane protein insertion efficiency factor